MKCVGVQYMEALRRLKATKVPSTSTAPRPNRSGEEIQGSFLRTVHIVWGPDEEITGTLGMAKFVETTELAALNIGFALDEGIASPDETYIVAHAERCMWWLRVVATGAPGHGSKSAQLLLSLLIHHPSR